MLGAIGRIFGKILSAFLSGIARLVRFRAEQLTDIRHEVAIRSINPERFQTTLWRDAAYQLKEEIGHSPDTLSELEEVLTGIITVALQKTLDAAVNPSEVTTPEAAEERTAMLVRLGLDATLMISAIDVIATAFSATLIRNFARNMELVLAAAGFLIINPLFVQTALDTRLRPLLARKLNSEALAQIPSASDLVTMELREVFQPSFREEQLQPPPQETYKQAMREQGFSDFWSDSYWAAHWRLPSITELNTMLWRDKIDTETWARFVRRNDFLPVMIPHLQEIIYNPYTRVDIRRMWQIGAVGDDQVVRTYKDQGYDEEHANNLLVFTRLERSLPILRARYKNGWISKDVLLNELQALGVAPDRVQPIWESIVKEEAPERVAKERDLTKAEIIKGVKKGVITPDQGHALLVRMGYDQEEAEYLLAINIEALTGSPETPLEFQKLVEGYRHATGQDTRPIPPELLDIERDILRIRQHLAQAVESQAEQEIVDRLEADLQTAEYRYSQLSKRLGS